MNGKKSITKRLAMKMVLHKSAPMRIFYDVNQTNSIERGRLKFQCRIYSRVNCIVNLILGDFFSFVCLFYKLELFVNLKCRCMRVCTCLSNFFFFFPLEKKDLNKKNQ